MNNYEIVTAGEPVRLVKCGDYIAASDGKIYKPNWHNSGKMREVKQSKHNIGYLAFKFNKKIMKSHRFIAMCFIPNPYNLPQVNHKNEIKDDNRVENLEWCDAKYNVNYGTRNKKSSKNNINNPKKSKPVLQFTKDGKFVAEYPSTMEVQRQLGFHNGYVGACCRGKYKTAYGFIWRFAD